MLSMDFPLPANLPKPVDDGAAGHLLGLRMPRISLPSTSGKLVDLSQLGGTRSVLYFYPMTGVPGKPLPEGWDMIPGARGCTPQTCGYRDRYPELSELGIEVFGCSTQTTDHQREMTKRLAVPFDVLSDVHLELCDALRLPTFQVEGMRLIKRLTLIIRRGLVERVFYPVFPPNESVEEAIGWAKLHPIPVYEE